MLDLFKESKEMTEAKLQASILRDLESRNVYNFKAMSTNRRGVPDIILCVKGRFVGLEIKRPVTLQTLQNRRSMVSTLQYSQIERIQAAKGLSFIVDSFEDYELLMQALGA